MKTTTSPFFWDCECKEGFVNPKSTPFCDRCGAAQHEQPDSSTDDLYALAENESFIAKLNDREQFELWLLSDNVVKTKNNTYRTQCTQYACPFTKSELLKYFTKQYLS